MRKIILFLLFSGMLSAQSKVIFSNTTDVDPDRYKDVKGSCYLFEDFIIADLYSINGALHKDILINLNGETGSVEARENEKKYLELKPSEIARLVIRSGLPPDFHFMDSLHFVHKPLKNLKSDYSLLLYSDEQYKLLIDYEVSTAVTVQRPPGQIIETKRFAGKQKFYLMEGDEVLSFELRKKELKKKLSKYGDLFKWSKKKGFKATSAEAIAGFVASLADK